MAKNKKVKTSEVRMTVCICSCCQDISCIKELIPLYEAATVEDVYVAYEQLKIDENCLFSCIGIAGSQAGEPVIGEVRFANYCLFSYCQNPVV